MSSQTPSKARSRKPLLAAAIAATLAIGYALAGFLLLPWLAQRELPRQIEQRLHQRAHIGEISFNPFTLRLQARDFALETMAGRPLLGFADAVVDLEWYSLLRRAWILDEVRLTDPALHLEIAKDGRLNLAALAPEADPAAPARPPRFAIGHLSLVNGSIDFEDARQGYRNRVEQLSIDLLSLSNLDTEQGSYTLQGQAGQGAKLRWTGALSLTPLVATGRLALDNLALAEFMPYANDYTAMRILEGRADLDLPYRLALEQGKPQLTLNGAKLDLRGLALGGVGNRALQARLGAIAVVGVDFDSAAQAASVKSLRVGASSLVSGKDKLPLATIGAIALDGAQYALGTRRGSVHALALASATLGTEEKARPSARLRQLAVDEIAFDLGAQRTSAKALRVADIKLALERDAKGKLDLLQPFADSASDAAGAAKPAKWQASIGAVEIADASARYSDRTARTPLALAADGFSGSFAFDATAGAKGVSVRIDAPKLALTRLQAASTPSGNAQPALRLANLTLAGTRFDSAEKTLASAAVRIGNLDVDTTLENGRVSLLDLLPAMAESKSEKTLSAKAGVFELGEGSVSVLDRASGIALVLQRLRAKLKDVSNNSVQPLAFDVNADVKSGGHIALRGRAVVATGRVTAKIEANDVALAPIHPLLARFASVKLASGAASLSGTLRAGGKQAKLAYSGSATVADLALDDLTGIRLIGWKALATDSLKASLSPDRVDIDDLRLTAPAGRFAIAKDGSSNLSRAFTAKDESGGSATAVAGESTAAASKTDAAPASTEAAAKAGEDGAIAVAVRRVHIDQGALDFSDDRLSPGFVAKIYALAGTANGLSSARDTRSQFALEGRVDEFGYARLSGTVNPLAPRDRSGFRVQLRNIDLATMSPYSMRFAGYQIATGRMALDLNYRVRDSLIEGDNKITLDKFTLGEHVDSPDALKLPFELAIALLKDADGTISLEVPVKGSLDDPQFSIVPLMWKAVGHLLGNIVAAPFRALAHLLGGGSEGQGGVIAFDPGGSRLLPPEQEKLARIVEALAKRPELKLEIPAHYDSEADARALKRAALGREIGRRAGFALADDAAPGRVNPEDKKTKAALLALFAERFGKGELDQLRKEAEAKAHAAKQPEPSTLDRVRNFASGEPQIADAREFYRGLLRRLRAAQPLPPNALAELAQHRASAIEAALRAAGVDPSRLEMTTDAPSADADAKQVRVQLSLAAR